MCHSQRVNTELCEVLLFVEREVDSCFRARGLSNDNYCYVSCSENS